jgi:subtilisin family serine protease
LFAPSLIHRLDKETSGALLIAKTGSRLRGLSETLRAGRLRKRYLALVSGVPARSEGEIDVPLAREDSSAGAKARIGAGKRAMTRYRILKNTGSYSLLQVIIETGRMHQIRAHLAHLGHPVAGDTRYHRPSEARRQRRELGLDRIFLHAEALSWEEDGGVLGGVEITAPGGDLLAGGVVEDLILSACSRYVCGADGIYLFGSGTSFAAPHVAAVAALAESRLAGDPTADVLDGCLLRNANVIRDMSGARDDRYGVGRLNAVRAGLCIR